MLTRENIQSGAVRAMAARLGLAPLLSDQELAASRSDLLEGVDLSSGAWLFGYGSLIWNPAFHSTGSRTGTVHGYHRRFCLWTHLGRGSPDRPGLALGLEEGGSCTGVAFHIAPDAAHEELDIVWRREMISGAYVPRWVEVDTAEGKIPAITFAINHAHHRYAGILSEDQVADAIACASGFLGHCSDYLINTVEHLAELGIHDRDLERLRDRVMAQRTDS